MTTKIPDKVRLFVTIVAIIGIAVAIGVAPSLWAAL
jgi:hypothetical protein